MKNLTENTGKIAFQIFKIFCWGLLAVFGLLIFAFFCIVLFGNKASASSKTASLLSRFGLQRKEKTIIESDTSPKLPLYIMLEDYTFYAYSERLNYTKIFKKDETFYGVIKQFDASHGIDRSLNLTTPAVMQDFIEMTGQELPTGIPTNKCRLLTKEESDAYYTERQMRI
jgi:hypothetical protein